MREDKAHDDIYMSVSYQFKQLDAHQRIGRTLRTATCRVGGVFRRRHLYA